MAAAQPIALPPPNNAHANGSSDYPMSISSSSLTGSGSLANGMNGINGSFSSGMNISGSFNPASYRRFMGSPLSFRAGSFGSRFYPGVSPGQLLGPLE